MCPRRSRNHNIIGLIRRNFSCLNTDILLPLYKAFVGHLVEYGTTVYLLLTFATFDCLAASNCPPGHLRSDHHVSNPPLSRLLLNPGRQGRSTMFLR